MTLHKKIKTRILENYNSQTTFYFSKILIFIVYIVWLLLVIKFVEKPGVKSVLLLLFIPSLFILNGYIELLFLPSLKIKVNMPELPKEIGGEKTLVQYSLPKNMTPSEVGMMMSWKAEMTNLICIIYKWVNEWLVKIINENGVKYIEVIDDLWKKVSEYDGNVWLNGGIIKVTRENAKRYIKAVDDDLWKKLPEYEYYLFYKLFAGSWHIVKFNKIKKFKLKVNNMILKSCVEKWYLEMTLGRVPNSEQNMYIKSPIWCASIICFSLGFLFLLLNLWLGSFGFFALATWLILLSRGYTSYYVRSTKKGDKLLADIYWYKYYLERCEEEQINSDLEDGKVYSKHLPYAIALKLNRKMIDELS